MNSYGATLNSGSSRYLRDDDRAYRVITNTCKLTNNYSHMMASEIIYSMTIDTFNVASNTYRTTSNTYTSHLSLIRLLVGPEGSRTLSELGIASGRIETTV